MSTLRAQAFLTVYFLRNAIVRYTVVYTPVRRLRKIPHPKFQKILAYFGLFTHELTFSDYAVLYNIVIYYAKGKHSREEHIYCIFTQLEANM